MESLKLDTTQNRNLNFAKFFVVGLLILWGVHYLSAAETLEPTNTAQEETKPAFQTTCKAQQKAAPRQQTL